MIKNELDPASTILQPESEASSWLQIADVPTALRYLGSVVLVALATAITIGLENTVAVPDLTLIFVIPVVTAAVMFGLGPSLLAAFLSALAFNFFLTEPRYSLVIDDPRNVWAMCLLFVVGCLVSAVASSARHRTDDLIRLRQQIGLTQKYSRSIASGRDRNEIFLLTADALETLFRVPVAIMLVSDVDAEVLEKRGSIDILQDEIEAAKSSLGTRRFVPAAAYPFDSSRFDFWPVTPRTGERVAIGVAFDPEERPATASVLVEVIASVLALSLERQHPEGSVLPIPRPGS